MTDRRLLLTVDLDGDGAHPAAWRHSGRPPARTLTAAALRRTVGDAEAAGFALATFADAPLPPSRARDAAGRLEAGVRAAFAASLTDRIGLAPTLHTTTTEPFHLATQLASLDHASRGRAAWVVGAASGADDLATIGERAPAPEAARREAAEGVEVARLLWDSWQDDAVIKDVATGRYLDSGRVHQTPPSRRHGGWPPSTRRHRGRTRDACVATRRTRPGRPPPGVRRRPARGSGDAGPAGGLVELLRSLPPAVDGVRLHPAVLAADLPVLAGGAARARHRRAARRAPAQGHAADDAGPAPSRQPLRRRGEHDRLRGRRP
ncbi:hypothetical protein Misp01_23720 [Microtetraspora sp. NBRC 13810]|uniref:LLM class flavin-dependent oxidoreductase n=1 Tax=Microtetraspora sp. NBRC 13810 TaxID=3030990 RepID=UPI0024A11C05|nr:LLM class flavin-dependent oxidoreductase [Microtetraspora sp. NBRC 13810]GLW07242.1 hypothetical protein Misp01_23720 [Microtetraspora sp. NBRC 13810]